MARRTTSLSSPRGVAQGDPVSKVSRQLKKARTLWGHRERRDFGAPPSEMRAAPSLSTSSMRTIDCSGI